MIFRSNSTQSEHFNIYSNSNSQPSSSKKGKQDFNFNWSNPSSDSNQGLQTNHHVSIFSEKHKLVVSFDPSGEITRKTLHTKRASLILLRRHSCPPNMVQFNDFLFFYIGNHQKVSKATLRGTADSLTFTGKVQDYNTALINSRFELLMMNGSVYRNLLMNYTMRPKVFQTGVKMMYFVRHVLMQNSEKDVVLDLAGIDFENEEYHGLALFFGG